MIARWWDSFFRDLARTSTPGHSKSGEGLSDESLSREELQAELRAARQRIAMLESADRSSKRSELLFGGLLEAAPDGFVIVDATGCIRLVNPQAERLFGYTADELVGKPVEVLLPEALREAHERSRADYAAAPNARRMGIGLRLLARRKDGSEFPTEISLSQLVTDEGRFIISAIRDVTDRRDAESLLRRQAEALRASNDQLQQFAYVASHDLQDPLRMVSSYLQLLQRRYRGQLDQDADEFIEFAVDGARRMQALIQDLLAYSRVGTRDDVFSPVDLDEVLDRVAIDLKVAITESDAQIQRDRLPTVHGDKTLFVQLFQNLIGNAIKFRRPDHPPRIQVRAKRLEHCWRFSVIDDGIGIDPQYRDRIFQIFQRLHTRHEYPGTGIGLAICKRIVERLGGEIGVESQPAGGTTFWFTVPDEGET